MKKLSIIAAAALMAVVGCQKQPNAGTNPDEGEKVYMGFKIATVSTKSGTQDDGTSTNGVEIGTDSENNVSKIDLVLKDATTKKVTIASDITAVPAQPGEDTRAFIASFKSKELSEGNYRVYVYVNADAPETFDVNHVYSVGDADVTTNIAQSNKFMMTSAGVDDKNMTTISDLRSHTSAANPLDLGTFDVERSAVRFDYTSPATGKTYTLAKDASDKPTVVVTLQDMALVNESKAFYDFKRVIADPTVADWAASWKIGDIETSNNYVVDTDWAAKKASTNGIVEMHYPLNTANESTYSWTSIPDATYPDYSFWKYSTENSMPFTTQKKGMTTGVAFRGQITATVDCPADLKTVLDDGTKTIYVFGNVLYGTWDMVKNAALATGAGANYALRAAYDKVVASSKQPADYASAGFTAYTPKSGKYLTTYYYWNRHNDNGNPDVMGPMEFATVRNNVYKLSVTKINKYGHPYQDGGSTTDPDPNPENPTDPDEQTEYYFTVSVRVLPWVVRINNIEF
ncbi:MAG: Mfa1 family fimbria major subunit [Bacteroidales bacterium]|nr:Mfa1 family fimbria major subunit [Bacteroidales bacterium]